MKRRDLLKNLTLLPVASVTGTLFTPETAAANTPTISKRDLFKELGVRTFINAAGTYTFMTGSLMHKEVVEAIRIASEEFCLLDELQDKAGAKIASLVRSESAVVTSGAFSGMTLGLAGILTGMDQKKVEQLPHLENSGMKTEVICQKAHDIGYNHAFMNTGCKIVMVETVEELENAINDKTALLHFLNIEADKGKIMQEEWVALGKKHGIPTSIDIAADVPPVSNLWRFNEMGFSFVVISGGKAIKGPQSAGLLMGKKEIIAAARLSMPPRGSTIGRGMKVNKEEIVGMYVAIEHYLNYDHEKEWKEWEGRVATIQNAIRSINGVTTEIKVPALGNITPTLHVTWSNKVNITSKELQEKLRNGSPSIEIVNNGDTHISITTWVMKAGEEKVVAKRLQEELQKKAIA
ncbi:MAG: aminotransferase class V-fold PLP-dependent enzyme [Chitinophagaceae bacterium]